MILFENDNIVYSTSLLCDGKWFPLFYKVTLTGKVVNFCICRLWSLNLRYDYEREREQTVFMVLFKRQRFYADLSQECGITTFQDSFSAELSGNLRDTGNYNFAVA